MKPIAIVSLLLSLNLAFSQEPVSVVDYRAQGNSLTFTLSDGAGMRIEFLDSKNLKFWVSPDAKFDATNESFAVVNEDFGQRIEVEVNESPSNFEVFTGDLRLMVHKLPFKVQLFNKYQRLLMGDVDADPYAIDGSSISTSKVLREDEHILGLGEKTGGLDRKGNSYTMWNSDKPCYSETEDPLYKSIPFFMSSYNYGIFFDNTYKTEFDFGKEQSDRYSFSSPDGAFIYYFFHGKDYREIIQSYTHLTGKPIMPPKWALGWSQSRGMLTFEKLSRDIAAEYRERNIPCDIIYQDIGWVEGLQNFKWREDRYSDPRQMLADLSDEGFKVIVSQDPVVSQQTAEQWKQADAKGYFAKDIRTGKSYDMPWPWGGNAGVVDFTNPEVADWWGKLQQLPIDDGVKGFWTDMGEPAWSNEESTDRLNMQHHLGMHDEIHNVYGLTWDKVVTEQFEKHNPNQRVFQMTRAAYAGLHRYTFGWSGDSGNGEDVTDGWESLANQVPMGLSAGMGLIPFWTTDISGYCGEITDYDAFSELYVRWLQFGIFNPLSRAHHEGDNAVEPWLFGERAEKIAKRSIELKYQLIPYLYTYSREAHDTGMPILRALPLEYPKDEKGYYIDDQFLFGKEFLVAPVLREKANIRKVYLPKGTWIDYNDPKQRFEGGNTLEYPVELETIPIFVREGAIIPRMPVMQYVGELKNAAMILEIFPSGRESTSFELYEDDGQTNDYKRDIYSKTEIEVSRTGKNTSIEIKAPNNNGYQSETRNFMVELHGTDRPKTVLVNGKKVKSASETKIVDDLNSSFETHAYFHDRESRTLYIRVPDTKTAINIGVEEK